MRFLTPIIQIHFLSRCDAGEYSGVIIQDITGKNVRTVLDPTLLLKKEEWNEFESKSIPIQESPYLLVYMLGLNKTNWKRIYKIAKELNIEVKIIPVYKKDFMRQGCIREAVGPAEFLSLIRSASFICTDSFHGLAFSITYEKPFIVFERFTETDPLNQNSRIYNLLDLLKLNERLNKQCDSLISERLHPFDYTVVNRRMNNLREESMNYLCQSLGREMQE